MKNEIKIIHLRESFVEIINFLNQCNVNYWVGRGLAEQIHDRTINDDENHDIDFHILVSDKKLLYNSLKKENYNIKQVKNYKIQVLGKADNRRIEFVFLFPVNSKYIHSDKAENFVCNKSLFRDRVVKIKNVKVKIPYPLDIYINCIKNKSW